MTLRILITGSRAWTDRKAISRALIDAIRSHGTHLLFQGEYGPEMRPDQITVVHGGARGADRIAGHIAAAWGMNVEEHPADWAQHGKAAGPIRNSEMVRLGADVCLAFPTQRSIGTRHCMQLARTAGISVCRYDQPEHPQDGSAA